MQMESQFGEGQVQSSIMYLPGKRILKNQYNRSKLDRQAINSKTQQKIITVAQCFQPGIKTFKQQKVPEILSNLKPKG